MLEVAELTAEAGAERLVRGVSFALAPRDTLAVLGASGSGKSLTARALLALPPRGITYGGQVALDGENLLRQPERALTRLRGMAVSMIFQEPATALNPVMRIGAQIAEPMAIHTDWPADRRRAKVLELLERTGLEAAGITPARYPHELSGGQRQRVAVAIALALSPKLVIADEPTSALDTVAAKTVLDLLFRLSAEEGAALVLITHDVAVARRAERTLVMADGAVAEEGRTADLLSAPKSAAARAILDGTSIELPARARGAASREALSVRDVVAVRGGRQVVSGAAFAVNEGERLAVVGSSGSGKTSLMRALVGLVPASGSITLDGRTAELGSAPVRSAVSMVFQDPATSFNPRHRVGRTVGEPFHGSSVGKEERQKRVSEALASVGLPGVEQRYPHAFSGGQRQRIAIARAIVASPRILIADEAVSALDAALRAEVVRLLDDLTREEGIALIFIAHDLALVRSLADRILVMDGGRIVESAATEDIFARPKAPATRELLAAMG